MMCPLVFRHKSLVGMVNMFIKCFKICIGKYTFTSHVGESFVLGKHFSYCPTLLCA
ncbi:unnamed protein product [Acanthoscelides obtectus]|uniref:Uncharacterized protein n=1 Tax=Acanthoscelides obtectus TaxID=200917 RepID=A0A9P0PDU1_ACAOB|nr:unnamed protein product [Acanthoscelides obtectus]CAK1672054.1 hypothetical protein AOBTE_LOCUS28626 [Acanthoscelides obtectus]